MFLISMFVIIDLSEKCFDQMELFDAFNDYVETIDKTKMASQCVIDTSGDTINVI